MLDPPLYPPESHQIMACTDSSRLWSCEGARVRLRRSLAQVRLNWWASKPWRYNFGIISCTHVNQQAQQFCSKPSVIGDSIVDWNRPGDQPSREENSPDSSCGHWRKCGTGLRKITINCLSTAYQTSSSRMHPRGFAFANFRRGMLMRVLSIDLGSSLEGI